MKTLIPEGLKGKQLFDFLVKNKSQLIATKKASIKYSDSIVYQPSILVRAKKHTTKAGAADPDDIEETGIVKVKVVCNTAWWCDSQYDVLTDTCYDKSIADKGILIPHIADHIHTSTSHVGDVKAVYTQKVSLKDLGLTMDGNTTCAIMETNVREDYNDLTYKFYKNGKINQHSIGLIYVSIGMCINDKDYLPEFEMWNKYYDKVINKDLIDEEGFFWVVPEIKWVENSCVLLGCNELTPTLEITDTGKLAAIGTKDQPSLNNKSMAVCPNCGIMVSVPDNGPVNCSGCGQYVSQNSNVAEVSTFDLMKAINETIFIKN